MRAVRRPQLSPRETGILLGAGLACALVLGGLIAVNTRWSATVQGGGGFYSIWTATREFLWQHGDPYGATAAANAQKLTQGGVAPPGQNAYRLDLPFFLVPVFFPLGLIADPNLARGVWATLAQMALIASTLLCARLVDWQPPRALLLLICLLALVSYPTVTALLDGTVTTVLLLVFVAILRSIQTGKDELAGGLAVMALCKWEVGLPFLLLVTLGMVRERRWRIAAGFAMTLTILVALAFLVYPAWLTPFLVGTVAVMRSGYGVSTQSALVELMPNGAARIALALTIATLSVLIVEALGAGLPGSRRFAWAACLALAAAPLIGWRSEVPNLVTVVPGLVMIAAGGSQRRPYGPWISVGLLGLMFGAPWLAATVSRGGPSDRDVALIFLLLPIAYLIGMYWTRWWFLRPARTWMDEIREAR